MSDETKPNPAEAEPSDPHAAQVEGDAPDAEDADGVHEDARDPNDPSVLAERVAVLERALVQEREERLRALADAENTRRRAEKDLADTRVYAVSEFAKDILSVADNLARARDALTPELQAGMGEAGQTLLQGVEMTERELHAILTRKNITPAPAEVGGKLDPNIHHAAAQIPSNAPAGTVAAVIQSGWMIGERILRPAMVAVSAGPPAGAAPVQDAPSETPGEPGAPGGVVDTKA